jgi:hypothetical protein
MAVAACCLVMHHLPASRRKSFSRNGDKLSAYSTVK